MIKRKALRPHYLRPQFSLAEVKEKYGDMPIKAFREELERMIQHRKRRTFIREELSECDYDNLVDRWWALLVVSKAAVSVNGEEEEEV